jgi:hypothetical protein
VNSDLSVAEIRTLLAKNQPREGVGSTSSFDELLQLMEADSFLSGFIRLGLGLVASSPRLQAWSKLMLIEVLGEIGGDPSNIPGVPKELRNLLEVLIQKRNARAVADLQGHIPSLRSSGSAAIFYGSGHMPDLEVQLRRKLHYKPAATSWLTAFSVDLGKSGISPTERDMVRGMAKKLLESISQEPAPQK